MTSPFLSLTFFPGVIPGVSLSTAKAVKASPVFAFGSERANRKYLGRGEEGKRGRGEEGRGEERERGRGKERERERGRGKRGRGEERERGRGKERERGRGKGEERERKR